MLSAKQVELATSVNSLATLLASHNRDAEAESLYKMSISVLDKHGFVAARKPVVDRNDPPSPLLAETLDQYAALLKKERKRSDAAKMEARARMLHGLPEENRRPPRPCLVSTGSKYYSKSKQPPIVRLL